MEDLGKVNSMQLYNLWKNLTVSLMTVVAMMTFSMLLPYFFSPVIALLCAAFLYVYTYNSKATPYNSCMIMPFAMLYCMVGYAFVTIGLNMMYAWGIKVLPHELIFFTKPFIPSLIFNPVCVVVLLVVMLRRNHLQICLDCRMHNESIGGSVGLGSLFSHESHFQLRNLIVMFGVLSVLVWSYYLVFYVNVNINARDWYIFTWVIVIAFILDELYFIARYYNLYLDLNERNEIITPEEINDMTAKTYLRYYVICGNNVYVDTHTLDANAPYKEVIDTPFFTKRTVNGIPVDEVKRIISKMTGYNGGELRFFYGRKTDDMNKHSILRYFYFLDGELSEYQEMNVDGEWMDFEKLKYLYSNNPGRLSKLSVTDITRLATIILTEKIFDENGFRKSKIKMYNPSFNLIDVRKSDLDFQDDKWLEISMFNSDTPMFRFKKWWRDLVGGSKRNGSWR